MPMHRSYTVKFKLDAVKWFHDNGGNVSATARQFNVHRRRIKDWVDNEDVLQMNKRGKNAQKKRIGMFYLFLNCAII